MIVVAIEGYDGSGKTTLVRGLTDVLESRGHRCAQVGRGGEDASSYVSAMTSLIKNSDGGQNSLSPMADMFLRLARLHARIELVGALDCDVVLLDRFLLYDLSRIPAELRVSCEPLFYQVAAALPIDLTVYLAASFELIWGRISSRSPEELSPKEDRGREYNRLSHMEFERVIVDQKYYRRVEVVDASQTIETVVGIVAATILALSRPQP